MYDVDVEYYEKLIKDLKQKLADKEAVNLELSKMHTNQSKELNRLNKQLVEANRENEANCDKYSDDSRKLSQAVGSTIESNKGGFIESLCITIRELKAENAQFVDLQTKVKELKAEHSKATIAFATFNNELRESNERLDKQLAQADALIERAAEILRAVALVVDTTFDKRIDAWFADAKARGVK